MLALAALMWGLALGLLSRGEAKALADMELRWWPGILAVFIIQAVFRGRAFGLASSTAGLVVWSAASLLLLVFLAMELTSETGFKRGLSLVMVGTVLNLLVVLANSGMPVSSTHAGLARAVASSGGFYIFQSTGTLLAWLGDVLELQLARQVAVVSAGDVLLFVGVAVAVIEAMSVSRDVATVAPSGS